MVDKPSSKKSYTVLIIEDDEMLAKMYEKKLTLVGMKVTRSLSGEEGEIMAQEKKFDVILLDIIMPGQDGFTTLKKLRANEKTKNIPVIMLTNLGQKSDIDKGLELGATNYLVKNEVSPGQVVRKIEETLDQKN